LTAQVNVNIGQFPRVLRLTAASHLEYHILRGHFISQGDTGVLFL